MSDCFSREVEECRNTDTARTLKMVAFASILVAGAIGIAIPIFGRNRKIFHADGTLFVAMKAFAAGVILATGLVHMLPEGTESLSNPCLWFSKFPFSGFFAMLAALLTLLFDFLATRYYEAKHRVQQGQLSNSLMDNCDTSSVVKVIGEDNGISATNNASNSLQFDAEAGNMLTPSLPGLDHHQGHGHVHGFIQNDVNLKLRHVVVSQILELGIVSHSIIIGLSLGVSESPCTIRPLIAALSFHQFFEGFALGGCISQAQFKNLTTTIMACFFAVTTPLGIGIGAAITSVYNSNSAVALITEGILDSMSAGILIYMALVSLIAADFFTTRTNLGLGQQLFFYFMILLGAGLMSLLAIWA